jgi:glycolate oxidase iron-sulfur subunit
VEERVARGPVESAWRGALNTVISSSSLFGPLLKMGQLARPLLQPALKRKVPAATAPAKPWPATAHARKMIVLEGSEQPSLTPATTPPAARVLDRLGISLVRAEGAGCCGGVSFHLNLQEKALDTMRKTIDAWWPHIEQGAEAIVITASGCGVTVKDYGHLLGRDPAYAKKAKRVSELTQDISEIITAGWHRLREAGGGRRGAGKQRIAFHSPCTLQHGLKITGRVESILTDLGFELVPVPDAHLCCGSAGTYSILQPELSRRLLENKIAALESGAPTAILTANIGCQAHLQTATRLPVRHWIEALEDSLTS